MSSRRDELMKEGEKEMLSLVEEGMDRVIRLVKTGLLNNSDDIAEKLGEEVVLFLNRAYEQGRKDGSTDEHDKTMAWLMEQIDEANKEESEFWYKDRCEHCKKDILPNIHHWVDSFYKNIKERLTQSQSPKEQVFPPTGLGNAGAVPADTQSPHDEVKA